MTTIIAVVVAFFVGGRLAYYVGAYRLDRKAQEYDRLDATYRQLLGEVIADKQLIGQYKTLCRQSIEAAQQSMAIAQTINDQNAALIQEGKHMSAEMQQLLTTTDTLQQTTLSLLAQHERTLAILN